MEIIQILLTSIIIILFSIPLSVLFVLIYSIFKDNEISISEDDFDEAFDTSVCKFIDETCFVRDKNCNIIKTHTHIVTDEKGAKQIFIDLKD